MQLAMYMYTGRSQDFGEGGAQEGWYKGAKRLPNSCAGKNFGTGSHVPQ